MNIFFYDSLDGWESICFSSEFCSLCLIGFCGEQEGWIEDTGGGCPGDYSHSLMQMLIAQCSSFTWPFHSSLYFESSDSDQYVGSNTSGDLVFVLTLRVWWNDAREIFFDNSESERGWGGRQPLGIEDCYSFSIDWRETDGRDLFSVEGREIVYFVGCLYNGLFFIEDIRLSSEVKCIDIEDLGDLCQCLFLSLFSRSKWASGFFVVSSLIGSSLRPITCVGYWSSPLSHSLSLFECYSPIDSFGFFSANPVEIENPSWSSCWSFIIHFDLGLSDILTSLCHLCHSFDWASANPYDSLRNLLRSPLVQFVM